MHKRICETYPYMPLTECLAITINTGKQGKEGLLYYMERFKQDNKIVKSLIGEGKLGGFIETTNEFKKLDEVDDAE